MLISCERRESAWEGRDSHIFTFVPATWLTDPIDNTSAFLIAHLQHPPPSLSHFYIVFYFSYLLLFLFLFLFRLRYIYLSKTKFNFQTKFILNFWAILHYNQIIETESRFRPIRIFKCFGDKIKFVPISYPLNPILNISIKPCKWSGDPPPHHHPPPNL